MISNISITGINQFKQSAIDALHQAIADVNGIELLPTVSLCHHCHSHVPAWRYHRDNKVYIVKHCVTHSISHHMIESDYEFYSGIYYTQDNPRYNFNGGVLIEASDRCNLECPHCYHLPDNKIIDQSIETLLDQIRKLPLGVDQVNRIILSGAEATLRPDFAELVTEIKSLDADISVTVMTNGIRFGDHEFVKQVKASGLDGVNIGLNHPEYIDHHVVRRKQIAAIENMHVENIPISYISYTMISLDEVHDIMTEICSNYWQAKNFRIRYGSDIGRNPGQERIFVSDVYKAIETWCRNNDKSFDRIIEADNNIYHIMARVENKDIRIIQWCDETDIDMEELRSGPWCDFVPDGVTNFLHQIIRRDVWKNQGLILPDTPPDRYKFNRNPHDTPLDLLNLSWSSNNHEPLI
jgi:sulfatase maturation enzyme AslB (radical SAM superfamily)